MITIAAHPLLEACAFVAHFSRPLGETALSEAVRTLLAHDAAAPFSTDDSVRKAVRDLLRHGGYKPTGRGKPASEKVIIAFTYAGFFAITGGIGWLNVRQWVQIGALFGIACWAALPLPLLLSLSVFINLHRGVVIGLLLEWLLLSVAFGVICSAVTVR